MDEIDQILDDPKLYCEECLVIRDKAGDEKNLIFNPTQQIVYEKIRKLREEGKPVRLVILKARQQGISTLTEGLIFHDTATRENRNSLIVSHDPESTKNIFKMSKFFYENLFPDVRPMKRYSNKAELVFENPDERKRLNPKTRGLGSQIEVSTASKTEVRSRTIHNFHASEVAFWNNAEDLMLAAMQMIPDHPDTMVILESTANGVGGYFHDMYWKAKEGKNDFTAVFLPWHIFPEYSRPLPPGFKLTQEEKELKLALGLTDEQVNWRRWCIANNCGGDELKFRQEYPATDREAFIVSGTPRFNTLNLSIYHDNKIEPKWVGELMSPDKPEFVRLPELNKDGRGRLRIYQWPNPQHSYVIGGDTAKGTEHSDYSVLQVLDKHTGDQVGVWRGKMDPTRFAYQAARLGYFYRGGQDCAFLGMEVNKDGITTNKVLHTEIQYPKLYRRRTIDRTSEKNELRLGFHTNERSRELILNKLARWIIEGEFMLYDETTIMECMTFVYDENGKAQAQEGCYDDCVLALAIAIHMFDYNVKLPPPKTEEKKWKDAAAKELEKRQNKMNW